jgi:predicted dehydrogenase
MPSISRRDFLHDSAALAAAVAAAGLVPEAPAAAPAKNNRKGDANDTLHVAVLGVHGRGKEHVHGFAGQHNCVVTTICDVDEAVIGSSMKAAEKAQGKPAKFEQDLRRVMDDKTIDIVSIATPNHWHALAAIWAMQAGKDVYVEKPVSHNVSEGRRIVEAARKYKKICQTGTQSRSSDGIKKAIEFLHAGKLGKLKIARGLCYKSRPSIGKVKGPQQPPKTMNYDLWCGPAPFKLPHRNGVFGPVHYDWHWIWDYGNGDLGNQGIHEMDKARWGLGVNELPRSVVSVGGRFGYIDDGETANTQICVYNYGDLQLVFEVRGLRTDPLRKVRVGNIFHCADGVLVLPNYSSGVALTNDGSVIEKFGGGGDHFGNFVNAVRSRKASLLNADILEGHLSSALCHLGNISYRLGNLVPFSDKGKSLGDNRDALEAFERMEAHLKDDNVPLDSTSYHRGRQLAFDAKTERFVNEPEADAYLTRQYRTPFVVPERI